MEFLIIFTSALTIAIVIGTALYILWKLYSQRAGKFPCPICKYKKTIHQIDDRWYCERCNTSYFEYPKEAASKEGDE